MTERDQASPSPEDTPAPEPETGQPGHPDRPTDFQLLMRKFLDLPDYRTQGPAAQTMTELRERIQKDPLSAIKELDAYLRGRTTGNLGDWTARNVMHAIIAAAATGADYIDVIAKAPLKALGPAGEMLGAGLEYTTDTVISAGANKFVEATTGVKGARYASPLSEFISTAANTIPVFHEYTNGVNLESFLRRTESIPIFGALLERGHIAGDRLINQALENKQSKWFWGLLVIMSKGYNHAKPDQKNSTSGQSNTSSGTNTIPATTPA
jgi:hypothetical protein